MVKVCLLTLLAPLSLLIEVLVSCFINSWIFLLFPKFYSVSVSLQRIIQSILGFHPNTCLVKFQVSHEILLKGHLGSDGLYTFPCMLSSSSAFTSILFRNMSLNSVLPSSSEQADYSLVRSASLNSITASTWRSRLGHPSAVTQKLVMQLSNIPHMNKL